MYYRIFAGRRVAARKVDTPTLNQRAAGSSPAAPTNLLKGLRVKPEAVGDPKSPISHHARACAKAPEGPPGMLPGSCDRDATGGIGRPDLVEARARPAHKPADHRRAANDSPYRRQQPGALLASKGGADTVFAVQTGRTISHPLAKTCKLAGITDLHFHNLRHEATSRLFENTDPCDVEIASIIGICVPPYWRSGLDDDEIPVWTCNELPSPLIGTRRHVNRSRRGCTA